MKSIKMKNILLSILFILITYRMLGQSKFIPTEKYRKHASRAFFYYEQKNFKKSGESYDSLFKVMKGQGLTGDKYNAACSWALANNTEKAFHYLNKVVFEDRWKNLSHILGDKDLVNLHDDKRWSVLIEEVTRNNEKAEAILNKPLVALLDSILKIDQEDRLKTDSIQNLYGLESRQLDSMWRKITYQDSINIGTIKNIIETHGWLGEEEVGEQGALTLFMVIQHADSLTQVTYLPLMREAVKNGKAKPQNLALLEDRILVKQGKKQIYGSQLKQNPVTGRPGFFPIIDEANVNKRREAVGLEPLEQYAELFGIKYVLPKKKATNKK